MKKYSLYTILLALSAALAFFACGSGELIDLANGSSEYKEINDSRDNLTGNGTLIDICNNSIDREECQYVKPYEPQVSSSSSEDENGEDSSSSNEDEEDSSSSYEEEIEPSSSSEEEIPSSSSQAYVFPSFACVWEPSSVQYGGQSKVVIAFDYPLAGADCEKEIWLHIVHTVASSLPAAQDTAYFTVDSLYTISGKIEGYHKKENIMHETMGSYWQLDMDWPINGALANVQSTVTCVNEGRTYVEYKTCEPLNISEASVIPSSSSVEVIDPQSSSSTVTAPSSSSAVTVPSSSSTVTVPSSSSAVTVPSSSSAVTIPSSSSVVPSSSSSRPPSSSSAVTVPSSSSTVTVPSSSSTVTVPSSSSSEAECRDASNRQLYCQWEKGCYSIDARYGEPEGLTCAEYIKNCETYGELYYGVTGLNSGNNYGDGVTCANNNGTKVGGSSSSVIPSSSSAVPIVPSSSSVAPSSSSAVPPSSSSVATPSSSSSNTNEDLYCKEATVIEMSNQNNGSANTTNAVCFKISGSISGWNMNNSSGRTCEVNGGDAISGDGSKSGATATNDGNVYIYCSQGNYTYFSITKW